MKYILKDYLALLKEDKELDSLVADLLFNKNIITISKPQRGRQYGVDIAAIGKDDDGVRKLFLLVIKQGNITRANWDSGPTSVRQTMNEIIDFYIPKMLTAAHKKLPKKIIVCTNGDLEQNVLSNWNGYVERNSNEQSVEIEFWGLEKISLLIDEYLIPENLFPNEYRNLLRKSLAFVDLPDYDLHHFYQLISLLTENTNNAKKNILKTLKIIKICLSVLNKWGEDAKNLKPPFVASEYTILKTWDWLIKKQLLEESFALQEFYTIHRIKVDIGRKYFSEIKSHYYVEHVLVRYSYNEVEYSLTVWEQLGILATIALTELFESEIFKEDDLEYSQLCLHNLKVYTSALQYFINNNPPARYPQLDEHLIEVSLALILLYRTRNLSFGVSWLASLIGGLNDSYKIKKFIPQFRTDYEELFRIHWGISESDMCSSMLIPILADWCVIFNQPDIYNLVKRLVKENYPEVNLQIWFPEICSEDFLYTGNASRNSGHAKCSITLHENIDDYRKEIMEDISSLNFEKKYKMFEKGFYYLAYISSRHYRSNLLPITWRQFVSKE